MYDKTNRVYGDFDNLSEEEKFLFLMSNDDARILNWFGKFVYHSFQIRDRKNWLAAGTKLRSTTGSLIRNNPLLSYLKSEYGLGHVTVAVLLPGFAINWKQGRVTGQPQFRDLIHIYTIMHKCTSLAKHDDTGIAKLLFILTTNGATDRDSVCTFIIYFTVFYLYICGIILQGFTLCMYCALKRMLYFVRKWRNKTDQSSINRAWQPWRHDHLPETSGTLWIHRRASTNQRCSLATGCGIT